MKTYIVDSFTSSPFKGNPAGVCLCENPLSDQLMGSIANELNFSETAFVSPGPHEQYTIRYFSPKMEIPLCGHATLAASKVLFATSSRQTIDFLTIEKHILHITRKGDFIEMEFPVYETVPSSAPPALLGALGIDKVINAVYNRETHILLLEIKSSELLKSLAPDYDALVKSHDDINGVLITAVSQDEAYDFQSRYFWPWSGTNEDPVTGGTHTFLTSYWSQRLHKTVMKSFQCSERSGFMEVELTAHNTLLIRGQAVILLEGEWKSL